MARSTISHLRLTFGGVLGSSAQEIWSCTIKLVPDTGGTGGADATVAAVTRAQLETAAEAYWAPISDFHSRYGMSAASLAYIKLNAYGPADTQLTDPTVEYQTTTIAGNTASACPWSTALVLEHRANGRSRGFASHGRISWPAALTINEGTGKVNSVGVVAVPTVSTAYATLLADLHTSSPGGSFEPAIVYTSTNGAKPAAFSQIDRCFASDIPGEIRRRQNKLTQGSTSVPVTGAD